MTTTTSKNNVLNKAETILEKTVQNWANSRGEDYSDGAKGALSDLFQGGCASGMVSELIYFRETLAFYKMHQAEISSLLSEAMENSCTDSLSALFGDKWFTGDGPDPLALDTMNQNLLAWFGFEETARNLANRQGWDI